MIGFQESRHIKLCLVYRVYLNDWFPRKQTYFQKNILLISRVSADTLENIVLDLKNEKIAILVDWVDSNSNRTDPPCTGNIDAQVPAWPYSVPTGFNSVGAARLFKVPGVVHGADSFMGRTPLKILTKSTQS